ncbi:vomeronasal type-2 receptor 26-like [Aquarana catesbeiana]|uniref:vomeronasal type-2 receptor 26-like n=1 Tax=Aquarana catesbeiana TaxID=8400 RepID=UPI003CC944E5
MAYELRLEIQRTSSACHLNLVRAFDDYEYVQDGDIIIGGVFTVNHFMTALEIRGDHVNSVMLCLSLEYDPVLIHRELLLYTTHNLGAKERLWRSNITVRHALDSQFKNCPLVWCKVPLLESIVRSNSTKGQIAKVYGQLAEKMLAPQEAMGVRARWEADVGEITDLQWKKILEYGPLVIHFGGGYLKLVLELLYSVSILIYSQCCLIRFLLYRLNSGAYLLQIRMYGGCDLGSSVPMPPYYRYFLTIRFAIDEINKDPTILPNITLGYHMYDSCANNRKAVKSVLQILSGPGQTVPNYSCRKHGNLAGFIGDQNSVTTVNIAHILALYRYTQVSYGATSDILSNRNTYPTFFRTVQSNQAIFFILSGLLQYLGWTWIGVISSDDDSGNEETQLLTQYLTMKSICVAYMIKIKPDIMSVTEKIFRNSIEIIRKSSAQVIILCGTFSSFMADLLKEIPKSQCSENCLPGTRKVPRSGIHSCCYDCVHCSEGKISNASDSENCQQCRYDEWPNEKKDRCVLKLQDFLSYSDDLIGMFFASSSSILCATTGLILLFFISHQDTAIVRANNRNLSFTLLVSIMLSFLCVFFFLGRPADISCMLRQTLFGILFTIAISSILAKTIMVYVVFKASKPGSLWQHWIGTRFTNSIVILCSSIQVLICVIWLSISPPFQDLDTSSYQDKIIVQCNEGSVIGFYSVLGYMGFLAAVSFVLAFMVRTLPDSFNEAKYITFSMLVFCSVWIAMIPAYLSTRGKYMVAVEIFAILSSSAGILGCIFLPKCYIILWRPELNIKSYLLEKRSQ